eukprot:gb/GEZN01011107.1/.p1 GENE.gb/GEZN01011107.1/~~gb/GEZN01011107.1/.p1  ORF type:complete len:327 (-),score=35.40 gb/GEZN01011107.1/:184-1164(-)
MDTKLLQEIQEFGEGTKLLLQGLVTAVQIPQLWAFYRSYFFYLLLCFIPTLCTSLVLLLLIKLLFLLLSLFPQIQGILAYAPSAFSVAFSLAALVALLTLFVFRTIGATQFDELFFASIALSDPELASQLRSTPYPSTWSRLESLFKRLPYYVLWAVLVLGAGRVPWVGPLVLAGSQFYLTYRSLGPVLAIALAVLALLPISLLKQASTVILSWCYASRALTQELLDPYLTRVSVTAGQTEAALKQGQLQDTQQPGWTEEPGAVSRKEQGQSVRLGRHAALWLGSTLPLTLVLSIPILGSVCFPWAQTALGPLAVRIHQLEQRRVR